MNVLEEPIVVTFQMEHVSIKIMVMTASAKMAFTKQIVVQHVKVCKI